MNANSMAPAFTSKAIEINAPKELIWKRLSEMEQWPQWQPEIKSVRLIGGLKVGSQFTWTSGNSRVVSRIEEIEVNSRLAWTGKSSGARAIHVWTIEENNSKCIVKTEESFEGLIVKMLRKMMKQLLDTSLENWLIRLKEIAEKH